MQLHWDNQEEPCRHVDLAPNLGLELETGPEFLAKTSNISNHSITVMALFLLGAKMAAAVSIASHLGP